MVVHPRMRSAARGKVSERKIARIGRNVREPKRTDKANILRCSLHSGELILSI